MDWFEKELMKDGKYIVMMQVFPGMFFLEKEEAFWKEEMMLNFVKIVNKHADKILFITGAHIHFGDIRVPVFDPS